MHLQVKASQLNFAFYYGLWGIKSVMSYSQLCSLLFNVAILIMVDKANKTMLPRSVLLTLPVLSALLIWPANKKGIFRGEATRNSKSIYTLPLIYTGDRTETL